MNPQDEGAELTPQEIAIAERFHVSLEDYARAKADIAAGKQSAREHAARTLEKLKNLYPEAYKDQQGDQDNG